jgi:transposase
MGFEPGPSKEGSWMMAQNDRVVAGIDVAKDKVDVCIRPLSLRRTFASTAEGRRELASWLRRQKVGKAVMEASGGYERDWTGVIRLIGFNNLGCARMPVAAEFEASGLSASNN